MAGNLEWIEPVLRKHEFEELVEVVGVKAITNFLRVARWCKVHQIADDQHDADRLTKAG